MNLREARTWNDNPWTHYHFSSASALALPFSSQLFCLLNDSGSLSRLTCWESLTVCLSGSLFPVSAVCSADGWWNWSRALGDKRTEESFCDGGREREMQGKSGTSPYRAINVYNQTNEWLQLASLVTSTKTLVLQFSLEFRKGTEVRRTKLLTTAVQILLLIWFLCSLQDMHGRWGIYMGLQRLFIRSGSLNVHCWGWCKRNITG